MNAPATYPAFLLNRRQAAHALSVSVRLLDQLAKERRLPFLKLNRRVLFDPDDLRAFIASQKQTVAGDGES